MVGTSFSGGVRPVCRHGSLLTVAVAAIFCVSAKEARAFEWIQFLFDNQLSVNVRGTIANQGDIIGVRSGQSNILKSYFGTENGSSYAAHVVRFLPQSADGPSYCEWVVSIDYRKGFAKPFTCGVTLRLRERGYVCDGYDRHPESTQLPCDFVFQVKK